MSSADHRLTQLRTRPLPHTGKGGGVGRTYVTSVPATDFNDVPLDFEDVGSREPVVDKAGVWLKRARGVSRRRRLASWGLRIIGLAVIALAVAYALQVDRPF